jgi:hypothetical protein
MLTRYSSTHEKTISNRSFRRQMVMARKTSASSPKRRTTSGPLKQTHLLSPRGFLKPHYCSAARLPLKKRPVGFAPPSHNRFAFLAASQ